MQATCATSSGQDADKPSKSYIWTDEPLTILGKIPAKRNWAKCLLG